MRRKAFRLGALQALVRLVCSFASVKLTAVYLGPAGLALIAQFNNFMSLCQGVIVTGLDDTSGAGVAQTFITITDSGSSPATIAEIDCP